MGPSRRSVLKGTIVGSVGLAGCLQYIPCFDDVACFTFKHHGVDDAPDILEITHTGGDDLPANEVYITNVALDYEAEETGTVAWSNLDDESDPTVGISGETIRIDIRFPDVVEVWWRHEDQVTVIGKTREFR